MSGCLKKIVMAVGAVVIIAVALVVILAIANPSTTTVSTVPSKPIEQVKAEAVTIEYKELFRNIESHVGKVIHATGEIVQAADNKVFRVDITKNDFGYSDTVWLEYHGDERFLEEDVIEFWATVEGLHEYESIMGGQVELPRLTAHAIELLEE